MIALRLTSAILIWFNLPWRIASKEEFWHHCLPILFALVQLPRILWKLYGMYVIMIQHLSIELLRNSIVVSGLWHSNHCFHSLPQGTSNVIQIKETMSYLFLAEISFSFANCYLIWKLFLFIVSLSWLPITINRCYLNTCVQYLIKDWSITSYQRLILSKIEDII